MHPHRNFFFETKKNCHEKKTTFDKKHNRTTLQIKTNCKLRLARFFHGQTYQIYHRLKLICSVSLFQVRSDVLVWSLAAHDRSRTRVRVSQKNRWSWSNSRVEQTIDNEVIWNSEWTKSRWIHLNWTHSFDFFCVFCCLNFVDFVDVNWSVEEYYFGCQTYGQKKSG